MSEATLATVAKENDLDKVLDKKKCCDSYHCISIHKRNFLKKEFLKVESFFLIILDFLF